MNKNWYEFAIAVICTIGFFGITYGIYNACNISNNPNVTQESWQKTLEYTGFDGKKHQCIVVKTGTNNWVLVERK